MAIIRLSCDRDLLFAPTPEGNLVDAPYDATQLIGRLGSSRFNDGNPTPSHADLGAYLQAQVAAQSASLTKAKPVVVMVHGFLFTPYEKVLADPKDCDNPHGRIYHFNEVDDRVDQDSHITPWPLRLGFAPDDAGTEGLAVAFGWYSNPGFASSLLEHFQNFYSRAYDYGTEAGWSLVRTIEQLAAALDAAGKANRIDLFCHSLGSHVVVEGLIECAKLAQAGDATMRALLVRLGRVIILGGAEYVQRAQKLYQLLGYVGFKKNEGPVFYNVGCRENDVLDTLAENFGPRFFGNSQVIGHNGLAFHDPANWWIDLQIDSGDLRKWARKRGLDILGDGPGVWDHWYYYTHRGNNEMYRQILRNRAAWDIANLHKQDIPDGIETNWLGN